MADKLILSRLNFALGWASLMRTRMRGVPAVMRCWIDTRSMPVCVCCRRGTDPKACLLSMGGPTAFDFAVTAPQRRDVLLDAGRGGGSAAAAYADVKCRHLDTAAVCEQHGVAFVPFPVLVPSTKFLHCSYPFMLRADIWSACTG